MVINTHVKYESNRAIKTWVITCIRNLMWFFFLFLLTAILTLSPYPQKTIGFFLLWCSTHVWSLKAIRLSELELSSGNEFVDGQTDRQMDGHEIQKQPKKKKESVVEIHSISCLDLHGLYNGTAPPINLWKSLRHGSTLFIIYHERLRGVVAGHEVSAILLVLIRLTSHRHFMSSLRMLLSWYNLTMCWRDIEHPFIYPRSIYLI